MSQTFRSALQGKTEKQGLLRDGTLRAYFKTPILKYLHKTMESTCVCDRIAAVQQYNPRACSTATASCAVHARKESQHHYKQHSIQVQPSQPHLMNQPSKKGCREDFGGGRGSNGDAPTTCGDTTSVPPPSKKAPMMDTTPRPFIVPLPAAGNTLLAAAFARGAAAAVLLLPGSAAAAFRLPLRRRARHGNDQAVLAVPGTTEVDFLLLTGFGLVAPPLTDNTNGMLLASGVRLLLPPTFWHNTKRTTHSARHISGNAPDLRSTCSLNRRRGTLDLLTPPPPHPHFRSLQERKALCAYTIQFRCCRHISPRSLVGVRPWSASYQSVLMAMPVEAAVAQARLRGSRKRPRCRSVQHVCKGAVLLSLLQLTSTFATTTASRPGGGHYHPPGPPQGHDPQGKVWPCRHATMLQRSGCL